MASSQRQKKVSKNQQETLIEYLKTNESFKTRKFSSTFTSDDYDKLWEELANKLNCDGTGPCKSVDKWKKMLADWKSNSKNKAARINKSMCGTGGGEKTTETLTDLEERLLAVWGKELTNGIAQTQEFGIPQSKPIEKDTSKQSSLNGTESAASSSASQKSSTCSDTINEDIYVGLEDYIVEEAYTSEKDYFISNVERKRRSEKEGCQSKEPNAEKKRRLENEAKERREAVMSVGKTKSQLELLSASKLVEKMQESQNSIIKDIGVSVTRLAEATEILLTKETEKINGQKEIIEAQAELVAIKKESNRLKMLQLAAQRRNNELLQSLFNVIIKPNIPIPKAK